MAGIDGSFIALNSIPPEALQPDLQQLAYDTINNAQAAEQSQTAANLSNLSAQQQVVLAINQVILATNQAVLAGANAQTAITAAQSALNALSTLTLPKKFQNTLNVALGIPDLASLNLQNTEADKGKYWEVTVGGTSSITGQSETYAEGDGIIWVGTGYKKIPHSDLALQKAIALEAYKPGFPGFTDVYGNDNPIVLDETGLKLILSYNNEGKVRAVFDHSLSPIKISDMDASVSDGFTGSFDTDDAIADVALYPIAMAPDKKMILSYDLAGVTYGIFDLSRSNVPGAVNQYTGTDIVWSGTSIPWQYAPESYPQRVARALGCTVHNGSISGSRITFVAGNVNRTGLSGTTAELGAMGVGYQNLSYEQIIMPYASNAKAIVIDQGPNDITFLPGDLGTVSPVGTTVFDRQTAAGAYEHILFKIFTLYPNKMVILTNIANKWAKQAGVYITAKVESWNTMITELCAKWGCRLLNLASISRINAMNALAGKRTTDDLHPTRATSDEWAVAITEEMLRFN